MPATPTAVFRDSMGDRSVGIYCIPMDTKRPWNTVGDRLGKGQRGPGAFHYNTGKAVKSPGGENHAQLRCLRRRTGAARPRSPTVNVEVCTASPTRITAAATSSEPRWPPASSAMSNRDVVRWWPCLGERLPPSMTGHTSIDSMCAITLRQFWASLIALGCLCST